jgi:predicted component of type VI protein secretion system
MGKKKLLAITTNLLTKQIGNIVLQEGNFFQYSLTVASIKNFHPDSLVSDN